jgi:hypothetical protein
VAAAGTPAAPRFASDASAAPHAAQLTCIGDQAGSCHDPAHTHDQDNYDGSD